MWRNYFVTCLKWPLLFQPGEELFPKDEKRKLIADSVDLYTHGRWVPRVESQRKSQERGNFHQFFCLWEWAVGRQTQQFMNSKGYDAGVVGRKPLLKCSQRGTEEENLGQWDRYLFPPMWYVFSRVFQGGDGNSFCVMPFFSSFLLDNQC